MNQKEALIFALTLMPMNHPAVTIIAEMVNFIDKVEGLQPGEELECPLCGCENRNG